MFILRALKRDSNTRLRYSSKENIEHFHKPGLSIRQDQTQKSVRGELVEPWTALRQDQGERIWG